MEPAILSPVDMDEIDMEPTCLYLFNKDHRCRRRGFSALETLTSGPWGSGTDGPVRAEFQFGTELTRIERTTGRGLLNWWVAVFSAVFDQFFCCRAWFPLPCPLLWGYTVTQPNKKSHTSLSTISINPSFSITTTELIYSSLSILLLKISNLQSRNDHSI